MFFNQCLVVILVCAGLCVSSTFYSVLARKKPQPTWEHILTRGNDRFEHGDYNEALQFYKFALELLDQQGIDDLRKAVTARNLGRAYRQTGKSHQARSMEALGTRIYKKQREGRRLGPEYSKGGEGTSLASLERPPVCPVCTKYDQLVPIIYGTNDEVSQDNPTLKDPKTGSEFRPGGMLNLEERWFCKFCLQPF